MPDGDGVGLVDGGLLPASWDLPQATDSMSRTPMIDRAQDENVTQRQVALTGIFNTAER